jgi:hypothetical protein
MYVERVSSIIHGHLNLELKSALRDISKSKVPDNHFALPQIHNLQLGGVGSYQTMYLSHHGSVRGATAYSSFAEKQ